MNDELKTPDQFESDLESLTIHEAGHWHVSIALGIPATMRIDLDDEAHITGGWCFRDFHGSKFEAACVGWAGVLAEHLLNRVWRQRTPLLFSPLTESNLLKFHWEASFYFNELSDEDRRHVVAHTDTLETCQATFRILSKRIGEIEADAKLLADRTRKEVAAKRAAANERKWAAVPRPPCIPATHDDFVRLVCGDAERCSQFIASKAQAHLSNGTTSFEDSRKSLLAHFAKNVTADLRAEHPSKSDDEIAAILFDENFTGIVKMKCDNYSKFPSADAWLAAARDFQQWATSEKK